MISQHAKLHKNTFNGGVNKDLNVSFKSAEMLVDAANISLVGDGTFLSAQNIKGTTNVQAITAIANTRVLGVFQSNYVINNVENLPCLTIFTVTSGGNFNIYCYDTTNDALYSLFQEAIGVDYITDDRVIDAVVYAESGFNTIYFTDNYNEIRKLRCEVPSGYTPNFLTAFDLSLLRRGAIGKFTTTSTSSGGSLFTGSYQVSYQLLDPIKKKYTKWSLLTNPIKVFTSASKAGIGLSSDRKLTLSFVPTTPELANYTHFRLAILENIYPEDQLNDACSLTPTYEIADYISGSTITYDYRSNLQNNLVQLSEIVIDQAPIKTVKTLEIRDNRLMLGNITYKNLDYDNGEPAVNAGIIRRQFVNPKSSSDMTNYVGYYRNELYRFAISYFDGDGNFSSPRDLDMSSISLNQSTQTGFKDMKFPDRSQVLSGNRYSLLDGVNPVNLGLQFIGVRNHPTWAKGFVILRRERIENIKWQSPLIPMMKVYGPGAVLAYPDVVKEQDPVVKTKLTGTTPMGPSNTYIPMDLNFPKLREIKINNSRTSTRYEGESFMTSSGVTQSTSIVYPPQTMYTANNKYIENLSHTLRTVDAVKLNGFNSGNNSLNGAFLKTDLSSTYYALRDTLYYYDDSHSGAKASLRTSNFVMKGYKDFDNLSEGDSINGKDVLKYDNITTGGLSWEGVKKPTIQRCGVVDLASFTPINQTSTLSFAAGGTTVSSASETSDRYTSTGQPASEDPSTYINTIEIVNCEVGLDDYRYGDPNTSSTYISTGATYTFSDAELVTVQAGSLLDITLDVWGGDCIVSSHTFKVQDTGFGVINTLKHTGGTAINESTAITRWGKVFMSTSRLDFSGSLEDITIYTASPISIPVAFKASEVLLQIYIESPYNGDVTDLNTLEVKTNSTYGTNSLSGVNVNTNNESFRAPLNYKYNYNISKSNNDKIFSSIDLNIPVVEKFPARIFYSDTKIYQTQIEGFDIFRVGNYYDLLESYGKITKLAVAGDDLYCLQDTATSFISVGDRVLETTDADQIAVRSGDFIGNVLLISTNRGCQHLKSVTKEDGSIFFTDNINKAVYRLYGRELNVVSDNGLYTTFKTNLTTRIPEYKLLGTYDPIRREYWSSNTDGSYCWVFNTTLDAWTSSISWSANNLLGSAYCNQKLYVIGAGVDNNQISVHEMYTGNPTYLMGTYVTPYIKLVVNPEPEFAKTFDDILFNSSDRLKNIDLLVNREAALGNQTITGINLDVSSRGEGNFRVKVLRDSSDRRLRGLDCIYTINWESGASEIQVDLRSIITKYRTSENIF